MKSLTDVLVAMAVGAGIGVIALVGVSAAATTTSTTTTSSSTTTGGSSSAVDTPGADVLDYGANG